MMGFYWDDWSFAWISKFLGPGEFIPAFAPYRPFLGPIFTLTTSLLPPIPIIWQIFGLIIRFITALAAWWTFRTIWPDYKPQALTASLFFLVFPGYSQQWVAFTHINQELLSLLAYIFSIGLTAFAVHHPNKRRAATIGALLLLLVGLFPTEYFFGLEPLRFLILWFLLSPRYSNFWKQLKQTLCKWGPYLLVWICNGIWLVYYYQAGTYDSYEIAAAQKYHTLTPELLLKLAKDMGETFFKAGFYTWYQVLESTAKSISAPSTLANLGLMGITFILITFYLTRLDLPIIENVPDDWAKQALILGFWGILLGRIPSWAAGLPLTLDTHYNRFMISMMLGGSLFAAGLIEWLFRKQRIRLGAISLIITLAVGQQFLNANALRRDWNKQLEIFWQLTWRIPDLEPGTMLLTEELPLTFESDLNLTAPINWIYAPDYKAHDDLPYVLLSTRERLDGGKLPSLAPGQPVTVPYRTISFQGSTSQTIVLYIPYNGCLRVLDPVYANQTTYIKSSPYLVEAIQISNPNLIKKDAAPPHVPVWIFGQEPEHDWCYFYEKAEIARQSGNWKHVVYLGETANKLGYFPEDAFEWLPFIEAYAFETQYLKAEQLSIKTLSDAPKTRKGLCAIWDRVIEKSDKDEDLLLSVSTLKKEMNCVP